MPWVQTPLQTDKGIPLNPFKKHLPDQQKVELLINNGFLLLIND